MLKWADDGAITFLAECALNILRGNVKLNNKQIKVLRRHRRSLRSLARPKATLRARRNVLVQRGGFIVPILAAISAAAGIARAVKAYRNKKK